MSAARKQHRALFLTLLVVCSLLSPCSVLAKEKSLGSFGPWRAYVSTEGGQTVCYMVTTQRIKPSAVKKRGTPYVMITHRPIEASTDVISYGAGALMNSRKPVRLITGKNIFELFSVRDTAWARDALTDHKIVAQIKNFPTLKLSGFTAKKPAAIIDIFDVAQAQSAYRAIGKACGLSGETPQKPAPRPKKPLKPATKK